MRPFCLLPLLIFVVGCTTATGKLENKVQDYPIHEAVINDGLDELRKLIKRSPDQVDQVHPRYGTPLALSIGKKRYPVALYLLESGANPLVYDSRGRSIFHRAIKVGDLDLVRLFCRSEKNLQLLDEHGRPPLFVAVVSGKMDAIRILLEAGADPNQLSKSCFTPLDFAVYKKDVDSMKVLLKNGAKPSAKTLHVAAQVDNLEAVEEMRKAGMDMNLLSSGLTPLDAAILRGSDRVSAYLRTSGGRDTISERLKKEARCSVDKRFELFLKHVEEHTVDSDAFWGLWSQKAGWATANKGKGKAIWPIKPFAEMLAGNWGHGYSARKITLEELVELEGESGEAVLFPSIQREGKLMSIVELADKLGIEDLEEYTDLGGFDD